MAENTDEDWRNQIDIDVRSLSNVLSKQGERLVGVEASISALGRNIDKFSHSFEATVERQQELQKTRWPLVLGVLTLVMVVIGGFMSGYLRDLNRIEGDVKAIQSNRKSEQDPVQNARIADAEAEILGIRSDDHSIMMTLSAVETRLDEWDEVRLMGVVHMQDGHPRRIEKMLQDLEQALRDYKTDSNVKATRELAIQQQFQHGLEKRIETMENRWAAEHTAPHHRGE